MQQSQTDPRTPIVIGIVVLGILLLGGIIWAVVSAPSDPGYGREDVNVSFNDDGDPTLGPSGAANVLHIFGDLQCPACKSAEPGITYLRQTYADRLKIVWDDFPLTTMHKNAYAAANAARCSEEQGKFWEMHDLLYLTQTDWSELSDPTSQFMIDAQRLELNEDAFQTCLQERTYNSKIQADMSEGNGNGVNATPTFFLNKRKIVGVLSPAEWDKELAGVLPPAASPVPAATSTPFLPITDASSTLPTMSSTGATATSPKAP